MLNTTNTTHIVGIPCDIVHALPASTDNITKSYLLQTPVNTVSRIVGRHKIASGLPILFKVGFR